ncbi:MAG: transposase [Nitrososphaerota archaeon]|nr:transposase [Nitrososphaerota archaeon]
MDAQKGHNADHLHIPQINMVMIFDFDGYRPVFLKPVDRSFMDVKLLRTVLEEVSFNGVLVLDRGFFSYDIAQLMSSRMKFIMPMRRNSSMIDYGIKLDSSFVYRDRGILSGFTYRDGFRVYIFQDQSLMAEEASNFIRMISEGRKTQEEFNSAQQEFGKISVLTNLEAEPKEIYMMYKQREEVEQAFDAMKNELENAKSYLSDDYALRGYFFISFVSLYLYYAIFNLVRKAGLTFRLSVNDALLRFSRSYMIVDGKREILSELPASVEKLDSQLGTNIFPKKV